MAAIPNLLLWAWLLPLASFVTILFLGPRLKKRAGYVATGAIAAGFVLSAVALAIWLFHRPLPVGHHEAGHEAAGQAEDDAGGHAEGEAEGGAKGDSPVFAARQLGRSPAEGQSPALSGTWYTLARFGKLQIGIGYYIDSLTLAMFCMVTLVAGCIHVYSFGYMHEELHEVTDPQVQLHGRALKRRGRFHRFYQYLSLFCFSMLGLVVAGNLAMVFVFWELVGICSYFLIGFYFERKSASNAANKAFIVNRVGDFGFLIGLMALWAGLGTFNFTDIFQAARPAPGHELVVPEGFVKMAARDQIAEIYRTSPDDRTAAGLVERKIPEWRGRDLGYGLLVLAGLGVFCGCVGKSAQFPLHVWLPDAMEGPTPVSALIHAATMVAAGVYLVGRFYPVFTPEVLMVIAAVGCITLFMAATIAITATDIKRVLAYSTVSQLGYMMLSLGVGGWVAGLFHLFTHAFFKSLLFLGSGSVIHACHTNEMTEMGGLRKKMPWTASTMLAGCLAISGAGLPLIGIGLSGYYSKDALIAQLYSARGIGPWNNLMFWVATVGAAITAFYMFRLWFMTFSGPPRNHHVAEHAHESPVSMVGPLVVLAALAVAGGWALWPTSLELPKLLEQARPEGTAEGLPAGRIWADASVRGEHLSHAPEVHGTVSWIAFSAALSGFLLATAFYGLRMLNPDSPRRLLFPVYWFLRRKWLFDELYRWLLVAPVMGLSVLAARFDREGIDVLVNLLARLVRAVAVVDDFLDRYLVDRLVNLTAGATYAVGLRLRAVQSGQIRRYVMLIVVGTVALFILMRVI